MRRDVIRVVKIMSPPVTMERGSPVVQLCNNINFVNFTLINYPPVLKDTTEQRHRSV